MQVLVGRGVVDRAAAGEHCGAGAAHDAGLPQQLSERDGRGTVQRAAGQFEVGDAGGRAGRQRAAIEAQGATAGERGGLVDGEQAGVDLHGAGAGERERTVDQIAGGAVRVQEKRGAVGHGDASAGG